MTTSPTSRPPRMPATDTVARQHPRGLTLIEILIAVGIVIALSAIALPIASWSFRLRPLDSARDGVESVVLQARALARIEGRPVEVRLTGRRLEARWFDARSASFDGTDDARAADIAAPTEPEAEPLDDRRIGMSWARRLLPEEIEGRTLEEHLLLIEDQDPFGLDIPFEESTGFDPEALEPDPLRIGVLLADGGALALDPVVLIDATGAGLLMEIDPWTGRPLFEPAPVATFEDLDQSEDETPEPERERSPSPQDDVSSDPATANSPDATS